MNKSGFRRWGMADHQKKAVESLTALTFYCVMWLSFCCVWTSARFALICAWSWETGETGVPGMASLLSLLSSVEVMMVEVGEMMIGRVIVNKVGIENGYGKRFLSGYPKKMVCCGCVERCKSGAQAKS